MNNLGADITDWTSNADVGGRDVFFKSHQWQIVPQLEGLGIYPYFQPLDKNQGPVATFRGKEVIMLGSNNYLGLTTHPEVKAAAQQAIEQFGTSMTGSRFVNGTLTLHEELEDKLAKFYGKEAGLVFTTGYQTNLGVMTALLNKSSVVLVDKRSHASRPARSLFLNMPIVMICPKNSPRYHTTRVFSSRSMACLAVKGISHPCRKLSIWPNATRPDCSWMRPTA